MSQPAFAPERHEIWYSDGASGFNVLRVTNGVWPTTPHPPSAKRCSSTVTQSEPRLGRIGTAQPSAHALGERRRMLEAVA